MAKVKRKQSALELVLLRNIFYRDAFKRVFVCVILVAIIDAVLLAGIIYKSYTKPQPLYFAATADGRIINQHPLTDPVLSNSQILAWVSNATQIIYQRDYVHWKAQLQTMSNYFTPIGWRSFVNNLKSSNNLQTLTSLKMITKVELTGVPVITQQGVVGGHYSWVVKVPVLVQYVSPAHSTISQSLDITYLILREPVEQKRDRIAINNFLPQTSGA